MRPRVSIIIPCFNQGHFLKDALESIAICDKHLVETIIVNDGSTDDYTNKYLQKLKNENYNVIFQENKGLSYARNIGISMASGDYILLLDADNKIRAHYITKSIEILDQFPDVAVVYGDAEFFGEKSGSWEVGRFNMQRLMISNFIDACAVIRKSTLTEVGLYDTLMRSGWEDWDLWLRIAFAGHEFYYVKEILFDYRVVATSMARTLYNNYEKPNSIENYIYKKYPARLGPDWIVNHYVKRFRKNPFLFIAKMVLRSYFLKYYNKLLAKNKIRNGL